MADNRSLLRKDIDRIKELGGKAKSAVKGWNDQRQKSYDDKQRITAKREKLLPGKAWIQTGRAADARIRAALDPNDTVQKANSRQVQQRMKEYRTGKVEPTAGLSPKKKETPRVVKKACGGKLGKHGK